MYQGQPIYDELDDADDANEILPAPIVFTDDNVERLVIFGDDDDDAEVAKINSTRDDSALATTMSTAATTASTSALTPTPSTAASTTMSVPSLENPTEITYLGSATSSAARDVLPSNVTPGTTPIGDGFPPPTPFLSTPPPPGLSSPLVGQSPSSSSLINLVDGGSPRYYDKYESISKQGFDNVLFESEV